MLNLILDSAEFGPVLALAVLLVANAVATAIAILPEDWFGYLADKVF